VARPAAAISFGIDGTENVAGSRYLSPMGNGPDRSAKAFSTLELCAIAGVESLEELADTYLSNIDMDVVLRDAADSEGLTPADGPGVELVLFFEYGYGTLLTFPLSIDDIVETAFEKEAEILALDASDSPARPQATHPPCPSCGADKTLHVRYGLPAGPTPPGEWEGGCIVTGNDPDWFCAACGHFWTDGSAVAGQLQG
jgi:hypothetical protein